MTNKKIKIKKSMDTKVGDLTALEAFTILHEQVMKGYEDERINEKNLRKIMVANPTLKLSFIFVVRMDSDLFLDLLNEVENAEEIVKRLRQKGSSKKKKKKTSPKTKKKQKRKK